MRKNDVSQLLYDAKLSIYRFDGFEEAILNFYIRAVAAYLVSKYPHRDGEVVSMIDSLSSICLVKL